MLGERSKSKIVKYLASACNLSLYVNNNMKNDEGEKVWPLIHIDLSQRTRILI